MGGIGRRKGANGSAAAAPTAVLLSGEGANAMTRNGKGTSHRVITALQAVRRHSAASTRAGVTVPTDVGNLGKQHAAAGDCRRNGVQHLLFFGHQVVNTRK